MEFEWGIGFPRGQIPELNLNPKFDCYMPIVVLRTGEKMVSLHDIILAVMGLTIWWEVGPVKKLQGLHGTGYHGNTESVPDLVAREVGQGNLFGESAI